MDDATLREGLTAFLSERAGRRITITGFDRPVATGFSAETLILAIAGSGSALPDRLVVQAAPRGPALFADYAIGRTFAIQQRLAEFGVPVASMRWLCEDSAWIGAPFYVMDHVDGRVPPDRPPYHREGWLFEASIDERSAIWDAGVDAIAALHRVPIDGFSFLAESDQTDAARQRIDRWRRFGTELGPDAETELLAALDQLEANRPAPGPLRVHWGDAKLGNMMFHAGRAAAILDWELCGLSVGEEDLAHWMAVDWLLSSGFGADRLPGLPGPADTIARYESAVGRRTEGVEWWFVFALVRMGLIFQRAAVQARRRNGGSGDLRPNVVVPHLSGLLDGAIWAAYGSNR